MRQIIIVLSAWLACSVTISAQQPASPPVPSGIKGIHHVSLSVRDLDRAALFYKRAIGLTEVRRYQVTNKVPVEEKSGIPYVARNVALLRGPNGQIELAQFDGTADKPACAMPVQGPGITHVCYQAPATSALYAKSKASGGDIVSRGTAPVDRGYGIQYAYAKDPDGILFELEQLDKPPFADSVWMGHVAIVTPNIERLVEFYTKLLGVKPHNRIDNIRNSPKLDDIANIDSLKLLAAWFKTGNMVVEIWQFDNPPTHLPERFLPYTQIGYNKISFEVSNLNQTYQQLRLSGLTFLSPPVSTAVLLRDPDGNLLSLEEYPATSPTSINRLKRLE
ncbi:MAG: Glyoxalase-like domain protein [Spirosoma sp.]|nr:Glyoxalase-like domain protein [Spirosoma sp.]